MKEKSLPRIVITLGDPAGVGAEVTLKALADPGVSGLAEFVVLGDRAAVEAGERSTGVQMSELPVEFRDCRMLTPGVAVEKRAGCCCRVAS